MCVKVAAAKISIIFWLLIFISACAPATVTMNSEFQDLSTHVIPLKTCDLTIGMLEDHRRDKESLGSLAYTEIFSVDPLLWVENGFKSFGIVVMPNDDKSDYKQLVQISLKVAHISSLLSAKAANTVLGLSRDGFETVEYFRGSHASINWSSSSGEIKKAFDISLSEAIQSIIESTNSQCLEGK